MKNLKYCIECKTPPKDGSMHQKGTCDGCGDVAHVNFHPPTELSEQDIIEIYNNIHFPEKRSVSDVNEITHYGTLKRFAEEALNYHQLNS